MKGKDEVDASTPCCLRWGRVIT